MTRQEFKLVKLKPYIDQLYKEGYNYVDIGKFLGISESSVRRISDEKPKELQPHGSPAGFKRHQRYNQIPCQACYDAWAQYMRQYRRSHRDNTHRRNLLNHQ